MYKFAEYSNRMTLNESVKNLLLEYEVYKPIPGTLNSYRQDKSNTSTLTQTHSHVYAKPSGQGKQIYAVNFDGSGHDGSSGTKIRKNHAEFFRNQLNYKIAQNNILESISFEDISKDFKVIQLVDNPEENIRIIKLIENA